ncbi:MAG: nuclear transport factor 2 family protein [Solirubrobacterales bacterium]
MEQAALAIEEIKRLKSRYFHGIDEKDWKMLRETLADDAVLDFSGEVELHVGHHGVEEADDPADWVLTGGDEGTEKIAAIVGEIVSVHQGHDPQITLTAEDEATGIWSMYDCLDYGAEVFHGYGYYEEAYRHDDGRWRIARLKLTRLRTEWR